MNNSVEQLIRRVSPTIVQIQVTGYGATDDNERNMTSAIIGRRRAVGSGVIVDPEGYCTWGETLEWSYRTLLREVPQIRPA